MLVLALCLYPTVIGAVEPMTEAARLSMARDAQQPAKQLQVDNSIAQTRIDSPIPNFPGGDEYGIQKPLALRANFQPWSVTADTSWFYSDNIALSSKGALEDWYLRSGLAAHYSNRIVGDWFFDAMLDDHAYLHSKYDEIDFNMISAEIGVTRRLPKLAETFLIIHYHWYGISDSSLTTEAFENHAISVALQKVLTISPAHQITVGLSAEYSIAADPAPPRRHECAGYIGYRLQLAARLSMNCSYRVGWYDYPETGRADWNHIVLIGASYDLADWARVGISASAAWNRSNSPFFNYDNIVSGVGVTLHLDF